LTPTARPKSLDPTRRKVAGSGTGVISLAILITNGTRGPNSADPGQNAIAKIFSGWKWRI
jgi:hypothetical protein